MFYNLFGVRGRKQEIGSGFLPKECMCLGVVIRLVKC